MVNGIDFYFKGYFQSVGQMFGFHLMITMCLFVLLLTLLKFIKEIPWRWLTVRLRKAIMPKKGRGML